VVAEVNQASGMKSGPMPDILDQIDGTLEDWATAQRSDAMRWQPGLFFPLTARQLETVRQVAHDTGLDGYAAWLAVADVMDRGEDSPYAGFVWPSRSNGYTASGSAAGWPRITIVVDMSGFGQAGGLWPHDGELDAWAALHRSEGQPPL
jgi:hypothetical protein